MEKNSDSTDEKDLLDDTPSKSQRKRDALRAVELAKALLQLSQSKRDRILLSAEITDALTLADGIRSNGAKKRQLHYIGKLLRGSADYESYWLRYENPQPAIDSANQTADIQSLELSQDLRMRDRLLDNFAATMDDLRNQYPNANIQLIRQLVNRIGKSTDQPTDVINDPQNKDLKALANALRDGRGH